jgi:hypothetical protein
MVQTRAGIERPFLDGLRQRLALQKLHHEVGVAVWKHAEVGDIDDVAVADLRRRLGFLDEALYRRRVLRCFFAEDLDRDRLVDEHVAGLVDHAHATFSEPRFDGVSAIDRGAEQRVCFDLFGC